MPGPEEWPSCRKADRIRLTGPAATNIPCSISFRADPQVIETAFSNFSIKTQNPLCPQRPLWFKILALDLLRHIARIIPLRRRHDLPIQFHNLYGMTYICHGEQPSARRIRVTNPTKRP